MSFYKLTKEQRDEWRGLPETKAAIAFLREKAAERAGHALSHLVLGQKDEAMTDAGGNMDLTIAANRLEHD